jgi:hypothetical protein
VYGWEIGETAKRERGEKTASQKFTAEGAERYLN